MAEKAKGGKAVKRKKTSQKWKNYEIKGKTIGRKNKFCPKCGSGVFMAKHKDRWVCGQCQYVEKF
jgi:ubiquitin-small subunit ribosomal protein S27Ae